MNVLKGDIGIVDNGSINQKTKEKFTADHSFMIAADAELNNNTPTVHLTWGGLETIPLEYQGSGVVAICRCPDVTLAGRALGIAVSWARLLPGTGNKEIGRNTYDFNRGKAVMHDVGLEGNLEFGFDALRRALKWSGRSEAPFSKNKGLTCAAWTVACYQAAALLGPPVTESNRKSAAELAESLRNPKQKAKVREEQHGTAAHYREHANVGAKTPEAFSQVVALLKTGNVSDGAFLESIMTKPLVVDARFLHSDGLYRRLDAGNSGWKIFKKGTDF